MLMSIACLAMVLSQGEPDRQPQPPAMPHREISPPIERRPFTVVRDGDVSFELFLPARPEPGETPLTIHFQGASWHAAEEHFERGLCGPLIVFNNGSGSSVYRAPFEDRQRLARWIMLVEAELRQRWGGGYPVGAVDISSFSAGYGAVREIVKSPEYRQIVRRIVLSDSMYASWTSASDPRPLPEHIDVWLPFCLEALAGRKTFCFTYSQVPTEGYASSSSCAKALATALGLPIKPVRTGDEPATAEKRFPLLARADRGHVHLWSYGGEDGPAHLTHVRHLAAVWKALDAVGAP
jgi:hypothetical protein